VLANQSRVSAFDLIIVDEIQDLLSDVYLDVFDLMVKGGLHTGNWLMFGDFERQMLFGQDRMQLHGLLHTRLGTFAKCSLRINCRNTPRVAALSQLLGKLAPNYSRVLRPDDRVEPVISYYATPSQQRKELLNTLQRLFKDSFSASDIVILSPKASPRCAGACITEPEWRSQLAPVDEVTPGQIGFTTVQSFKGLDAPAIVLTDVEHVSGEFFSSLFYVATTRVLERLHVLAHETVKPSIIQALVGHIAS
jgi:hypothetical protein